MFTHQLSKTVATNVTARCRISAYYRIEVLWQSRFVKTQSQGLGRRTTIFSFTSTIFKIAINKIDSIDFFIIMLPKVKDTVMYYYSILDPKYNKKTY